MARPVSLQHNRQFLYAYRKGKSFVHPLLVTYVVPNRQGVLRLGITASKKVGNAVLRNRAKRVISAAFRQLRPQLPSGYDYVFVARSQTPLSKMQQVNTVMERHLATYLSKGKDLV